MLIMSFNNVVNDFEVSMAQNEEFDENQEQGQCPEAKIYNMEDVLTSSIEECMVIILEIANKCKKYYIEFTENIECNEDLNEYLHGNMDVIQYLLNLNEDITIAAMQVDGKFIEYVNETFQTSNVCKAAFINVFTQLEEHRSYIDTVRNELDSKRARMFADDEYDDCESVIIDMYQHVINKTDELNLFLVKRYGSILEHIENKTEELCYEAIATCPSALEYIENQTPHMCFTAIKKDPCAIKYVREDLKSFELCKLAILNDPDYKFRTEISNSKYMIDEDCEGGSSKHSVFDYVKEEYKHNIVSMLVNSSRYNNYLYNIGMHLKHASHQLIKHPRIKLLYEEEYSLSYKRLNKDDPCDSYSIELMIERLDVPVKNIWTEDIKVFAPKFKTSSAKVSIQHLPNDAIRKISEFLVEKPYIVINIDARKIKLEHWINYYKHKLFGVKISEKKNKFTLKYLTQYLDYVEQVRNWNKINNLEQYFQLDEDQYNIDIDYTTVALNMILA